MNHLFSLFPAAHCVNQLSRKKPGEFLNAQLTLVCTQESSMNHKNTQKYSFLDSPTISVIINITQSMLATINLFLYSSEK